MTFFNIVDSSSWIRPSKEFIVSIYATLNSFSMSSYFHKMGFFDSVLKLIPLGPLLMLIYLLRIQPFFSPHQLEDPFIISNVYTVTRLDGKHHLVWFGIIHILTTIFFNRLQSSLKLRASETHMGKILWHCNLFPWGEFSMCCWAVVECVDHTVDAPKRIVLCKVLINTFLRAMEEIDGVFWIILLCYH